MPLSYDIGLGLLLNLLFWVGVVAVASFLGVFVIKEFFPGGRPRPPKRV